MLSRCPRRTSPGATGPPPARGSSIWSEKRDTALRVRRFLNALFDHAVGADYLGTSPVDKALADALPRGPRRARHWGAGGHSADRETSRRLEPRQAGHHRRRRPTPGRGHPSWPRHLRRAPLHRPAPPSHHPLRQTMQGPHRARAVTASSSPPVAGACTSTPRRPSAPVIRSMSVRTGAWSAGVSVSEPAP